MSSLEPFKPDDAEKAGSRTQSSPGSPMPVTSSTSTNDNPDYLKGTSFWIVTIALGVQVFIVNLEIPVVTTSLVAIVADLGGFDKLSWVLSSYLLGYVAIIVIFAKLGDIFGRKPIFTLSIVLFIIFSAACSASQNITQLIIFRALQGLGGGGSYSLSQVIITDIVPPSDYSKYVSQLSIVSSLALLLGPIIGGAISSHTTWRWIFIINVPVSVIALVLAMVGMPRGFGFRGRSVDMKKAFKSQLAQLDILGAVLLLFAVLSITAGFQEAGSAFPWRSAYVITLLVLSIIFWTALLLWEHHVTLRDSTREPVLPSRFFSNRVMVGALLGLFFLGGPIVVSIFQIPERFQLVYGLSGLDAGVRLIPFSLAVPFGTGIASSIATKFKIPAVFIIIAGSVLQVVGFALLGTLPDTLDIPPRIYGFEILAGFGCGMNFTPLFIVITRAVEQRDQSVGLGAGNQFRLIGSAVVIAVSTSLFNSYTGSELPGFPAGSESSDQLSLLALDSVRLVLSRAYKRQMLVLAASAAAQIPAGFLLWKREQILI
ncbi:putative multidrug resistance protein fnx1 [Poronia punctata]|nr:putative multidrug resistance protein fnx1 [Poronia punctata]